MSEVPFWRKEPEQRNSPDRPPFADQIEVWTFAVFYACLPSVVRQF